MWMTMTTMTTEGTRKDRPPRQLCAFWASAQFATSWPFAAAVVGAGKRARSRLFSHVWLILAMQWHCKDVDITWLSWRRQLVVTSGHLRPTEGGCNGVAIAAGWL